MLNGGDDIMVGPIQPDQQSQPVKVNVSSDAEKTVNGVKYASQYVFYNVPKNIKGAAEDVAKNLPVEVRINNNKYQIFIKKVDGITDKDVEGVMAILKKNNIEAQVIKTRIILALNTDADVKTDTSVKG
jgi:cell division protein ZapA (FtsZ GTPase activity inhibitor)